MKWTVSHRVQDVRLGTRTAGVAGNRFRERLTLAALRQQGQRRRRERRVTGINCPQPISLV